MANTIKVKRSSVPAKVPTTTDLDLGEIAVNTYDGKMYIKKDDGTPAIVQIGAGGGGSGDVVGPASATDNALARFDSTTGKLIQNSVGILDDSGNLTGINSLTDPNHVTFNTAAAETSATAKLFWDDGEGVLSNGLKGGNVTLQIGSQEYARVYNDSGSTLTKGQVVYISGAQGNRIAVKLAKADVEATSFGTIGLVSESIANGAEGFVIVSGALYKLDTTGLTAGATVYLSPTTAGAITTTKPQAPNQLVVLGWVERVDNIVGSIYVKVDNGYELDELHDVQVTSPASGNLLIYDASTSPIGVWKNAFLTAGTGISVSNGAGSVTVTNSAPDQVVAISGTSPVSVTGTYPNFTVSMTQSSGSVNGWLSSTDWTTFNNKQVAYTNLTTIGSLANSAGWLYNNGTGTFSYSTPTAADVGAVPTARTLTINGTSYDLTANRTWSVGTVTSVAALTLGTTGTDLSSSVATGTTTPVITLNVPTASATNRGALSAADWSTFNSKAPATSGTSILYGNGSGGFSNVTIGTGLSFTGGTLSTNGTTFSPYQFIATASQTTFAVGVTLSVIQVFVSGVLQKPATDYTVSGTNIVLTTGVESGTIVSVYVYDTFSVANTYTQSAADALFLTQSNASTTYATKASPTFTSQATFAAGTVSLPAITTTGDTNTGIFFPAADTIAFAEGGVEAMRIDSSSRVTTPFQTGFIAKGLAAQTTYSAGQVIVFNTAAYNVGSGYNTTTGVFTAPVAGLYLFTFQIYLNPGSTNSPIGFYKNGTLEIFCLQGVSQNGIGLSSLISMSANDTVDVRVRAGTGGSATIFNGGDHTQFTGRLLG